VWTGTLFGPHWESIFQPWPEEARAWEGEIRRRTWTARIAGLGALGLLALGLGTRRRVRRREALETDRLAALAHSLKTPLAIHKLRCDTLRMGRLDPVQAGEELLRLGQEVDELTRLIERGLIARQEGHGPGGQEAFGPGWIEDVAESLRPALEEAGRRLDLRLEGRGRAHLPSLESALLTLLENAYYHGEGTVRVASEAARGRLGIEVSDEGRGLDPQALGSLGQPFQRVRVEGEEGFRHQGQGLGLHLLAQVARQEGWGFEIRSGPGQGFTARLEVPISRPMSAPAEP
jgi:signal transduction histidine kinase